MTADTETTTPPERCPVCGASEDWRDTDDGRVNRVTYMCGAKWAQYNASRVPLSPPEWVSDCCHAMTAALRCGATLEPTPLEQARAALVDAAVAWWKTLTDEYSFWPGPQADLVTACHRYLISTGEEQEMPLEDYLP